MRCLITNPSISLLCLLCCLLLTACEASTETTVVETDGLRTFPVEVGSTPLQVELALTAHETRQGLMYRESLPENNGMLFLFDEPQRLSFWMRNTSIPLDIGYFDRLGVLREIYPLYPYDEQSVSSQGRFLQYALEVNRGWFAKNEIRPGAQLDLAALIRAVEARGGNPDRYGLRDALEASR